MEIRPLKTDDREAVERFLHRIPEGDRTFFKENVEDPEVVTPGSDRRRRDRSPWTAMPSSATSQSCR